jgi:GTP-binding protein
VDVSVIDPDDPLKDFVTINRELREYSPTLGEKPQLLVLNKMDVPWAEDAAAFFSQAHGTEEDLIKISAATGEGLDRLTATICELLDRLDRSELKEDV